MIASFSQLPLRPFVRLCLLPGPRPSYFYADLAHDNSLRPVRPTNFWRKTSRSALNSPLASPASFLLRRSSLINTGDASSEECAELEDLLKRCESLGKLWGERIKVKELLL